MASVRCARPGFFPLDDELQLLPGCLTPRLQEHLTRLGAWMPFGKAAGMWAVASVDHYYGQALLQLHTAAHIGGPQ